MPGIAIQATFDVKQGEPIDSRLVANDQSERENISYKYVGLKVYQKDINRTFTFRGPLNSDWDVEGSGLYGGSGSLVDNTTVDFGTVSNPSTSKSFELSYQADTTGNSKSYLYNYFYRHTSATPGLEWKDIEFRHQYKYLDNSGNLKNSTYISFNPLNPSSTQPGAMSFHTGFDTNLSEKMRISWDGKVGIGTNDPKEFLQIGTSSTTASPLVLHNSGSAVIGYNWYFSGTDQSFDVSKPSTKLVQSNGTFEFQNRLAGAGSYTSTIFTTGANSGRVGIRTTSPTVELDVNGNINSNRTIRGENLVSSGTVSSDNRVLAKRYDFTQVPNSYMYTYDDSVALRVGGTTSFYSSGSENTLLKSNFFGDVTAYGDSKITNYEPSTILTPSETFYWSTNTGTFSNSSTSLSSYFTYSITAYRVGALVNINYEIVTTNPIGSGLTNFFGIMFRISNDRFKPSSSSFGSGIGGNSTFGYSQPLVTEVFQADSTGGGATSLISTSDFWLRIRTTATGTFAPFGTILSGNRFFGTITFRAGDPTSPPPPPVDPEAFPASLS